MNEIQKEFLTSQGFEEHHRKKGLWVGRRKDETHYIDFRNVKIGRMYKVDKDGNLTNMEERVLRQMRALDERQQKLF